MTLGRLMELYQAEQQGKQIMMRERRCGYFESYDNIEEVKLSNCDLSILAFGDKDGGYDGYSYTFFIKNEEDEWGCKIK
jgi:hypothetical protein